MIYARENPAGVFAAVTSDMWHNGVRIPFGNLAVWNEAQRNAVGVYGLEFPTPPTNQVMASYTIQRIGDAVQIVPVWAVAPAPQLTFLEFMNLLTPAEQAAVVSSDDAQVKIFLAQATGAQYIDLGDPRLSAGLEYLVTLGLLGAGRPGAILTNQAPT